MIGKCSRCLKMYDYVLTKPRDVDAGFLRDWLSSMGLYGGFALYKFCADHYSDYCGVRRCLGIEIKERKLKYSRNTIENCRLGEKIIKSTLEIMELFEKHKAQKSAE